jgi:hypothetical protein
MLGPAHDADGDFRQAELRMLRSHHDIALRHHDQATAERMAVDGGDHRNRIAPDRVENLAHDARAFQRTLGVERAEFGNIAAGDKCTIAGTGEHDAARGGIVLRCAQRIAQFAVCRDCHGIGRRPVDRDQQHMRSARGPGQFDRTVLLHEVFSNAGCRHSVIWSNH